MGMICKLASIGFVYFLTLFTFSTVYCLKSKHLLKITDDNWRDLLKDEWMVNFYNKATWCPACKEMERPWNAFAEWSKQQKLKVAEVDLAENPGLSGRFLLIQLPTIYHVKNGVFRPYHGPKDKEDFIKFVKDKQWSSVEPIPSWCYPDSTQMSVVASLFKFSTKGRDLHNYFVDQLGLPSVASFGVFGLATLVLGCILGFFMVLIIDRFVPSGGSGGSKKRPAGSQQQQQTKKDKKNNNSGKNHQENGKIGNNQKENNHKNGHLGNLEDESKNMANGSIHKSTNNTNDKKKA